MKLKLQVEQALKEYPWTRERKNRYGAIWFILKNKYNKDFWGRETFLVVGPEILSITRLINHIQRHYPELRGSDYLDGTILAQEKQIELGYEPGLHKNVKRIKSIL